MDALQTVTQNALSTSNFEFGCRQVRTWGSWVKISVHWRLKAMPRATTAVMDARALHTVTRNALTALAVLPAPISVPMRVLAAPARRAC